MDSPAVDVILKRFAFPDEVRTFDKGRFATAAVRDGRVIEMRAGDVFCIGPGHDSWVVGDEPYVSFHFLGAEKYARAKQ